MGKEKDDVLRSILEIRRKRDAQPEAAAEPEPDEPDELRLEDPDHPSSPDTLSRGQALLRAMASKRAPSESQPEPEPPAAQPAAPTPAPSIAEAKARAGRTQLPAVALIRVCPSSFSGYHEWVYPAQRRGAGDIYCRHCGHRKANR
jgi:hypothetical protein